MQAHAANGRLAGRVAALPRVVQGGAVLLAIGGLAAVDYVTGSEAAFSVFYLPPILFATWFLGRGWGVATAMVCSLVWGVVQVETGVVFTHPLVLAWNGLTRFGFFLTAALLLAALQRAYRRLHGMAFTDALTGVGNTRSFYEALGHEMDRASRYGHPFTVAYVDLDHFKQVNDRFGHAAGDDLLCAAASAIRQSLRKADTIARLGGDEFAMLLPETDEPAALAALERVRQELDGVPAPGCTKAPCIAATIGAVVFDGVPESAEAAVQIADNLMYDGKRAGRATVRIVVHRRT